MPADKPYIEHRFLGVRSFIDYLSEAGVSYTLFDDPAIENLFAEKCDILNRGRDSVLIGACTDEGLGFYFAQFGIRITESFTSHIVFVFDHHPRPDELAETAVDMEPLVLRHLDGVDIGGILRRGSH
ncbi:MAG TPA: hypothetical protein VLM75_03250 [Spirochaetota bacterium]|nr:hypothetical protein [Spirochaetota bacterium]